MPLVLKSSSHAASALKVKPQVVCAAVQNKPLAGPKRTTALADLPQIMIEAEMAAYLDMTATQVIRLRYEKQGPKMFKLGKYWRVRREDLIAWIEEQASK